LKKVLIITYYWPPSGGPVVQRVLKYVKYLYEFGWEPVVLTVQNGEYPAIDESLLERIPKNLKIVKTKWFEPFSLFKKLTGKAKDSIVSKDITNRKKNESFGMKLALFIRANMFIPDARIGWIYYLVRKGLELIKSENIDIIFSTSPPHSVHLGAKRLARKSGLKWVADFRDPWQEAYWKKDFTTLKIVGYLDKYLEKSVLLKACAITTVSSEIISLFKSKVNNNYFLLHNGFENIELFHNKESYFKIIFIGNLTKFQNPKDLFIAVSSLNNEVKKTIKLEFIGNVFDDIKDDFSKYPDIIIEHKNYMPHKELMTYAQSASMLFFPYYKNFSYSSGIIGAKLFDYFALSKPILALGEKGSTADRALAKTERGILLEYGDIEGISKFINSIYSKWEKDKYIHLDENEEIQKFKTKENVKKLTKIFRDLLDGKD
jgi:hypothetical protein